MAENLQQRLNTLKTKAGLITERYRSLAREKRAADAEIEQLRTALRHANRELAEARQRIEHLTVVTTLNPGRQDIEQTRVVLSDLVREIDQCINELTQ